MSTDARPGAQSDAFSELLRGSLWPTVAAAGVCVVVGVVSFTVTLLVMKRTAELPPTTVMLVVMVTYTVKVLVLGLVMFAVRDVPWLSGYAVGVTITVCALVWLFFELRAYKRLRIFAYDPNGAAALPGQEDRP